DRDLGSAIHEAQRKIAQQVELPAGSRLEWVGEFGNLQDAIGRLKVVVPITLALIALLLWINFGSLPDTLLAMSVIPMAVIGGMMLAPLVILITLPVLILLFSRRAARPAPQQAVAAPAE